MDDPLTTYTYIIRYKYEDQDGTTGEDSVEYPTMTEINPDNFKGVDYDLIQDIAEKIAFATGHKTVTIKSYSLSGINQS